MRIANVPLCEALRTAESAPGEGNDASLWTKEQTEYAAEAELAVLEIEQELDRIRFDCFMALAEHRRGLRSARRSDERDSPTR